MEAPHLMDFKMLGHDPITASRISAAKKMTESIVVHLETSLKNVSFDANSKMAITMLQDAIDILKKDDNDK